MAGDGDGDGDGARASARARAAPGPASLPPFALERFFAKYEFASRHLLCCSDCEPWTVRDLLEAEGGGGGCSADALLAVRLAYTETRGDPALRAAIASRVYGSASSLSPPLDPGSEILVVTPQEGIFLATQALALQAGESVIVTKPGYQSLYEISHSCGARVTPWRPRRASDDASGDGGGGRLAFDARDLEALLRPVIDAPADGPPLPLLRAVFVNFVCHNPTGFLATDALWRRVAELLSEAGAAQSRRAASRGAPPPPPIVLFSDEMYAHMEPWRDGAGDDGGGGGPAATPPRVTTALELPFENKEEEEEGGGGGCGGGGVATVVLCGVSKSWGCPGLRVGWLASRAARHLLDRASELRDYTTICSPAPCERLALAAVEATDALTRAARARVAANARLASDFFGGRWRRLFDWPGPPDAGPICFPAARAALLEAAGCGEGGVGALCDRLAAEAGVLLLPATVYDDDEEEEDEDEEDEGGARAALAGRFRLGLGRDGFAEGLAALDVWLVGVAGAP